MDIQKQVLTVKESKLFDEEFYAKTYLTSFNLPGLNPIEHYIVIGWKLGNNPNKTFSTSKYLEIYEGDIEPNLNPLLHHILFGETIDGITSQAPEFATQDISHKAIYESGLFDIAFYEDKYLKGQTSQAQDPVSHYLEIGWKQGFDPSPNFITNDYLELYDDVKEANINPLLHYIKNGINEGRFPNRTSYSKNNYFENHIVDKSQFTNLRETLNYLKNGENPIEYSFSHPISLILPVYGNFNDLEICIDSIYKNTSLPFRLIIIDDANPEQRIVDFLRNLSEVKDNVLLIRNKKNLGFVRSVNSAIPFINYHFAILNTDIEVPSGWLGRLMQPICQDLKIASTTPFTNSGTICSFPVTLKDNPLFEDLSLASIDETFQAIDPNTHFEIPTGVGFCMGFNKDLVDKMGFFDEETFYRGYGEENDWCMRAKNEGFRNTIVSNLFVYHKHGGSFSNTEKQALLKENLAKLNRKHKSYDSTVQQFIKEDPLSKLRNLAIILASTKLNRKITLLIDHSFGGGANLYSNDIINAHIKESNPLFLLTFDRDSKLYLVFYFKDYKFNYRVQDLEELQYLLSNIALKEIVLNNLFKYKNPYGMIAFLIKLKEICADIRITIPIHDYISICPNFNLINKDKEFCYANDDLNYCNECLKALKPANPLLQLFDQELITDSFNLETWRTNWGALLNIADKIICFSEASKDLILKTYKNVAQKLSVTPHQVNYLSGKTNATPINIGILGNISFSKGGEIIHDILKIIDKNGLNINILLFGSIYKMPESKRFVHIGKYKREDLQNLVGLYKIDVFFISSIWAETFSYTTEELITLNQKVACFDLGAPVERIRKYKNGTIIPKIDPEIALQSLIAAARNLAFTRY